MGLALGKTRSEIRAIPYPEFYGWQLYEMLEPFGWRDREERTGLLLAQIYNTKVEKKSKAKQMTDFIRDMPKLIIEAWEKHERHESQIETFEQMSKAEKRRYIANQFGAMGLQVTDGNSSDNSGETNT